MAESPEEIQVASLIGKIRHYLITGMGKTAEEAKPEEFYKAFAYAMREQVMINWTATTKTYIHGRAKMLYYLSMEYLPGRFLKNSLANLGAADLVRKVLFHFGKTPEEVYSLETDPGLGNGGLGRLASCFLESFATQGYPAVGYGLRYQYGIFEQELWEGVQMEKPDCWLLNENPWEFRRDSRSFNVRFGGRAISSLNAAQEPVEDLVDYDEVRALPYDTPIVGYGENHDSSVLTLRLWTTKESPRNFELQRYNAGHLDQAAENTNLTDVLYPNDNHEMGKRIRLKQEFLLVSASIQDILHRHLHHFERLDNFAEKVRIQINDTHPSLVIAELMRLLTKSGNIPWKRAWEMTQAVVSYTNHTVMIEALEQWDQNRLRLLLPRQCAIIEKINQDFCNNIRSKYPNDEEKVRRMSIIENSAVHMANLAVVGSHKVNGVSELHTDILKKDLFKDFYEDTPQKFVSVTNGVTHRRWLWMSNPLLAEFITKKIGNSWMRNFEEIKHLREFASDPLAQDEFLQIKKENKRLLALHLENNVDFWDERGVAHNLGFNLNPDSLFDMHIKRVHEYKRQVLNALHVGMLYHELLEKPGSRIPRTVIFSGKAAPGYEAAKNIIRFIHCLGRKIDADERVKDQLRVIYVPNYNVSLAEVMIPAADLSQQISAAGTEASGTGNMKLSMNGALTIGTRDGANIEMEQEIGKEYWPFAFGLTAEEIAKMKRERSYNSWEVYSQRQDIQRTVELLRDGSLVQNDAEHQALLSIYKSLFESNGEIADHYFVIKDLIDYYDVQKKVEALYQTPNQWAEMAMHNIAGMGKFSIDSATHKYAKEIWGLEKMPVDKDALSAVRELHSQYDRCRIF